MEARAANQRELLMLEVLLDCIDVAREALKPQSSVPPEDRQAYVRAALDIAKLVGEILVKSEERAGIRERGEPSNENW